MTKDAQLFLYFGYKKSIEKFQMYQKKRGSHLNNTHYLKPYIGSSMHKDQKLQCVEAYNIFPIKYAIFKVFFKVNL